VQGCGKYCERSPELLLTAGFNVRFQGMLSRTARALVESLVCTIDDEKSFDNSRENSGGAA
jgi:hypothetical protein